MFTVITVDPVVAELSTASGVIYQESPLSGTNVGYRISSQGIDEPKSDVWIHVKITKQDVNGFIDILFKDKLNETDLSKNETYICHYLSTNISIFLPANLQFTSEQVALINRAVKPSTYNEVRLRRYDE